MTIKMFAVTAFVAWRQQLPVFCQVELQTRDQLSAALPAAKAQHFEDPLY